MFEGQCLRVVSGEDGIAELCFDRRNEAINKFDVNTVAELKAATGLIRAADRVRGVLVTSAKEAFIVGADIFEFTALFAQPQAQIKEYIARQNAVFTAFDDLHVPSVVAINGLALGGGLEMALAADARVMAASAHVGLPEVSLGIFPGFGGTVRLPRLTGAATAIEWITSGKPQSAQTALATGAVDAVVTSEALRNAAFERLRTLMRSNDWRARRQQRRGAFEADSVVFHSAKSAAGRIAKHQPAALASIELLERAAGLSRDAALELEHAAFAQISHTQAAASLVQLFVNDQAIKKKARSLAKSAHKVRRAGILGVGILGGGIAYSSAVRGIPAYMKDITRGALDLGVEEASKLLSSIPLPLVEVIRGPGTHEGAIAAVVGYTIELGKTPVIVKECPGFLVNRILTPYMIGFLRAVHDGADFLSIDRVMEEFGWPMGPAYLQDVVGLDTLLHVLRVISAGLAPRLQLDFPHAVELLVQQGRLGQKGGGGFYRYERDPAGKPKKLADPLTLPLLATIQPHGRKALADQELLERLMLPMIIEAARCLEEGIVESPGEIDTGLALGLGFPRYAGGPLKYADWLGVKEVVARCEAYANLGPMYEPTDAMRSLAAAGVGYYDQHGVTRRGLP